MSLIECFTPVSEQFYYGVWYENLHSTVGKNFRYALLDDPRKEYGVVINNLIKSQDRKMVKTSWDFNWQPKQVVIDNEGKRWKITQVIEMPQELSPQSAYSVRNPNKSFALSLVQISNPMEIGK